MSGAEATGISDLVGNLIAVDVIVEVAVGEETDAIATDFGDTLGAGDEGDNQGSMWTGGVAFYF